MASQKRARRPPLTPEDWIRAAIEALLREGTAGLRVARLARTLGVTSGSFYWHFADRTAFRDRILDYWIKQLLQSAALAAERAGPGSQQIRSLGPYLAREGLPEVDVAIRRWAGSDEVVAAAVARADEFRIRRATGMLEEAGFDAKAAEHRARMLLWLHVGSIDADAEMRRTAFGEFLRMILQDPKRKTPAPR